MLFNPHSQIQDEPTNRPTNIFIPQVFPLFQQNPAPASPTRARSLSLFSNGRHDDWLCSGPQAPTSGSLDNLDTCNTSVTYDIYGNELLSRDDEIPHGFDRDMDLESIEEEEIMSPDAVAFNQENKDPVMKLVTPLKKRNPAGRVTERRNSFALSRGPLLDITPPVSRRKCSYHVESKFEVSYTFSPFFLTFKLEITYGQ